MAKVQNISQHSEIIRPRRPCLMPSDVYRAVSKTVTLKQEPNMPSDFPTSFDKDGLLKCARGELFGQGNAQLPEPPMLMMDRVTEISSDGGLHGKGHVIAEFDINPELWFFKCHFPGDPVMPGCLGLDALWQLAGFHLAWLGNEGRGRALGCGEVKFTGQVMPHHKKLTYQIDVRQVFVKKTKLIVADGNMQCDGKTIYVAKKLKV